MSGMARLEQERKQAAKQQDASPSKPKKDKKRKRESGDGIEEEGAEAVSSKSRPVRRDMTIPDHSRSPC